LTFSEWKIIFVLVAINEEVNQMSLRQNKKERKNLFQKMEVEIQNKGNFISQYNTLRDKEHIKYLIIHVNRKGGLRSFV